jgi:hypothetical protein
MVSVVSDKKCCICDSNKGVYRVNGEFYCSRHATQLHDYGKILERTKHDRNEIVLKETYAEIVLYNSKNKEVARALIDLEDVDKIREFKWHLSNTGYVRGSKPWKGLHNVVLDFEPSDGKIVDHTNRNRLDCRKSNLRIADYQTNAINKGKQSNNTSGYPGVCWDISRNKYLVRIKIKGKTIYICYCEDLSSAIVARRGAELKYFGEIINRDYDVNTVFKHN